jgi:lysophospholipase L1-like esterase
MPPDPPSAHAAATTPWTRRALLRAAAGGAALRFGAPLLSAGAWLTGACSRDNLTIHPPLEEVLETIDGRQLRYMRFPPGQRFRGIEMPDFPFYVGIGDPDPYRRKRRYSCSSNAQGFRGPREWSPRKEPGSFRIACIGDGITFGEGVDDERDFPTLMHAALRSTPGAPPLEVLNLGTPCRLTDEALPFFEVVHARFEVDHYLFIVGVNDALPMFHRPPDRYRQALQALLSRVQQLGVSGTMVRDPANTFFPEPSLYEEYSRIFTQEVGDRLPLIDLPALLDEHERRDGLRWETEPGEVQKLVRYRAGQPEVLVRTSYRPDPGQRPIAPEIYRYLDSHPVSCATFITDCHLNEQGHRIVAGILADHLRAQRPWERSRSE